MRSVRVIDFELLLKSMDRVLLLLTKTGSKQDKMQVIYSYRPWHPTRVQLRPQP